MPMTIRPVTRRSFLQMTAAGAGALMASRLWADVRPLTDANRFALFSDTHINADPLTISRRCNMADQLNTAVRQVLALDATPAAVLINGDCAHQTGEAGDYVQLLKLTAPLSNGGLPVCCALGNHDQRDRFWQADRTNGDRAGSQRLAEDRQMLLIKSPHANWIVLDTLDVPRAVPGRVGEAQLRLLERTLDDPRHASTPTLIMMHHNPEPTADPAATQPAKGVIGVLDTKPLFDVLLRRKHVKAVFFGHTHKWERSAIEGMHLVNLPAIGYPFAETQPTGWIDFRIAEKGAKGTLVCIDPKFPKAGETIDLAWR
ncbi:MAG: metallophosphoesterase [Burkholderiales bacterium]|nr:metallophosphoesterase [Phycisphaerae bacterium]